MQQQMDINVANLNTTIVILKQFVRLFLPVHLHYLNTTIVILKLLGVHLLL